MRYVVAIVKDNYNFPKIPNGEDIESYHFIPDMDRWDIRIANRFIRNYEMMRVIDHEVTIPILKSSDSNLIKHIGMTLYFRTNKNNWVILLDINHDKCGDLKSYLRNDRIENIIQ